MATGLAESLAGLWGFTVARLTSPVAVARVSEPTRVGYDTGPVKTQKPPVSVCSQPARAPPPPAVTMHPLPSIHISLLPSIIINHQLI